MADQKYKWSIDDIVGFFAIGLIFSPIPLLIYQCYLFIVFDNWTSFSLWKVMIMMAHLDWIEVGDLFRLQEKTPGLATVMEFIPIHVALFLAGLGLAISIANNRYVPGTAFRQ